MAHVARFLSLPDVNTRMKFSETLIFVNFETILVQMYILHRLS